MDDDEDCADEEVEDELNPLVVAEDPPDAVEDDIDADDAELVAAETGCKSAMSVLLREFPYPFRILPVGQFVHLCEL